MTARRGTSGLSGILLVDKPGGITSHDVVNRVRRITGERRVGHAGTLDPMATGLLVVLVGPATRLAPYLTAAEKSYDARFVFGARTDTDDAEGAVVEVAEVPDQVLDRQWAADFVGGLVGVHQQTPPAYSAIKRDGVTAYAAARQGRELDLEPRTVQVTDATLRGVSAEPPAWDVSITVSKGTYIRAIARDIGADLGTAAHLGALRRTRSGAMSVDDAISLDELERTAAAETVEAAFAAPAPALGLPVVALDGAASERVSAGAPLNRDDLESASVTDCDAVAVTHNGRLLGVYAVDGPVLRARTVIPGGVTGGGSCG